MSTKYLAGCPLAHRGLPWSPMVSLGLPVVSHFAGCPCRSQRSLAHRGLLWSPVVSPWSPTLLVALAALGRFSHPVDSNCPLYMD